MGKNADLFLNSYLDLMSSHPHGQEQWGWEEAERRRTPMKEAQIASGWAKQYIRERGGIVKIATRMTVVD
jgi:hypothetical protein